jgi:1-deoxy-D-xylulose-5-phosphate synthase
VSQQTPITADTITGPEDLRALNPEEADAFAGDVRRFLLENISKTGGHIGANLGTVELSIALHRVFHTPDDSILWDTGHQGYTHKIITGRAKLFPTLNTYRGMNRFVTRMESDHDPIEASHAGTSISVALGMALARRLSGNEHGVVAVIGDGAMAEGMAFEALNHASVEDVNLTILLNDNGFAISPGFGALHEAFQCDGDAAGDFFRALGYGYVGPLDGHNIAAVESALTQARDADQVTVVHAKTEKGHGWPPAKDHPFRQHFSFPFDIETAEIRPGFQSVGYPDVAGAVVCEEMEHDTSIVAITPSTLYATGLAGAFAKFPDRCFDPGMEEQHAMTLAVGLALEGLKPVVAFQSTFMQRAFDQLIHDVCFMKLPTLLLSFRSGFSGYDNPTHHGVYDFAYLRGLPNLDVMYPKDRFEAERMISDSLQTLDHPVLILMPYGPVDEIDDRVLQETRSSFARAEVVATGHDLLLVTVGHKFAVAAEVVDSLRNQGHDVGLVNLRHIKPLPEAQLATLMADASKVVTLEEAVKEGGIGSAIADLIVDRDIAVEALRIGLPTTFIEPGSNDELCKAYGLDPEGVLDRITKRWPRFKDTATDGSQS